MSRAGSDRRGEGGLNQGLGPCLVVGSSRGLGAAMTARLLTSGAGPVLGVARTPLEAVGARHPWARSARYRHLDLDVAVPDAVARLERAVADLPSRPLLVIHNAAVARSDLHPDGRIDWPAHEEVNRIGIVGFVHVLRAVEPHLRVHGGVLAGVSSYAALAPPIRDPRLAYPASKAYLEMSLRALRHIWRGRVRVVTVRLGNMAEAPRPGLAGLLCPSYDQAAARIVAALTGPWVPERIEYPWPYALVYGRLLRLVPDRVYFAVFERLVGRGAPR